jgi:hypothetical protein
LKNVIILTGGLAGSSVLTSLLGKAGYWVGESTMKKKGYDTWENTELIALNKRLLEETGFREKWTMRFRPDYVTRIREAARRLDAAPYAELVRTCEAHSPWIWKDPRLWLTIRHWRPFLDLQRTCFLVIRRDHMQSWISTTLRRQVQTMDYARAYSEGIHQTIVDFLQDEQATWLDILYEDLLITPEKVIGDINRMTGTSLTLADFTSVFRGELGRKQHGAKNFLIAMAIYLKNYGERYR